MKNKPFGSELDKQMSNQQNAIDFTCQPANNLKYRHLTSAAEFNAYNQ